VFFITEFHCIFKHLSVLHLTSTKRRRGRRRKRSTNTNTKRANMIKRREERPRKPEAASPN
jgi:hypothetical protein